VFALLLLMSSVCLHAQIITTIAGNGLAGYGGDGAAATAAELNYPFGVAIDGSGNMYIADEFNNCIRKVDPSGVISTFAGNVTYGYSGDGGAATAAELDDSKGVAVDGSGNVYIADAGNNRIRKVAPTGVISTIAGNGTAGYSGDGGAATAAELNYPNGVAVDGSGNVYIADTYNHRIRKVSPSGVITTIAGNGTAGYSGDGAAAIAAALNNPGGVAVDGSGNVYIADAGNNRIRKVAPTGVISTIAGNGTADYSGDGGAATAAQLNYPVGVAVDGSGNVYIADQYNLRIRKVNPSGVISTFAGNGGGGYFGDGGAATAAGLFYPTGVAVDGSGNVYIGDHFNQCIRKVSGGLPSAGAITGDSTVCAGSSITLNDTTSGGTWSSSNTAVASVSSTGVVSGIASGVGTISYTLGSFVVTKAVTVNSGPSVGIISGYSGVAIGASIVLSNSTAGGTWSSSTPTVATISSTGVVYGVSEGTDTIKYSVTNTCGTTTVNKVITTGSLYITTIAGNNTAGYSGDGGAATAAELYDPRCVAVDGSGNVYIADAYNNRIRKVDPSGVISTFAGNGTAGYSGDGGAATAAELSYPRGVAVDGSGNVYIADQNNNRVRKVAPSGFISTFAGNGTAGYSGDGGAATAAKLYYPTGVAVDGSGNVYIADYFNHRIRKVDPSGVISTIAGNSNVGYSGDGGAATAAKLYYPLGVAVDGSGNVYIADEDNHRIRKVNPLGIISTIAGNGTVGYSGDGGAATAAELDDPTGVAVDGSGNVYIADQANSVIRKVDLSGVISTFAGNGTFGYSGDGGVAIAAQLNHPAGVAVDGSGNVYIADYYNNRIRKVISGLPSAGAITGDSTVCAGSSITLTDTTSGGTWMATNGYATVAGGIVTGVSAGVDTIQYSVTTAFGTAWVTKVITVSPLPNAGSLSGASSVCISAISTLTDAVAGGTWSSSNTSVASVSTAGVVSGASAGTTIISYSVSNSCGTTYATHAITVSSSPTVNPITGTGTVCAGATTALNDVTTGGSWSSANTSIATVNTSGVVTGLIAGSATISYTYTNSCGTVAATSIVTVNPLPAVNTITGTATVCAEATTTLNDITTGGSWSSTNTSIATVNTSGVVNGVIAGTTTISYTYTNSCGTVAATSIVTVNPLPAVNAITGAATVCAGATTTLNDVTTGGAWSSTNTAVATVNTSGVVRGVSAGTAQISYSVTNICGMQYAVKTVTVGAAVSPIAGSNVVCSGSTATFADSATGGIWGSSNSSVATISSGGVVTGVAAGVDTIYYSVSGSCGTAVAFLPITVSTSAFVAGINGGDSVCVGSSLVLTDSTTSGTWRTSNLAVATITGTGTITGLSAGITVISYTITSSCGIATAVKTVSVNAVPTIAAITGVGATTVGALTSLSDATPGGVWSSSNNAIATINAGGTYTGVGAGLDTIYYRIANACGNYAATKPITVVGPITGASTVCVGSYATVANSIAGGTWSSSNTAVLGVFSTNIYGYSAGTATISYSVGGVVVTKTVTVVPNTLPAITASSSTGICVSGTVQVNDSISGGTWSSSNTTIASVSPTGLVTAGTTAGAVNITYTNSMGCYKTIGVSVNNTTIAPITASSTICVGSYGTMSNTTTGGTFAATPSSVLLVTTPSSIYGVAAGTATLSYTKLGCSATKTITVVPNTLPAITASSSTGICVGGTVQVNDSLAGGTWSSSNPTIASVSPTGFVIAGTTAGAVNITYTSLAGCYKTIGVNINNTAIGAITAVSTICTGNYGAIADTTAGGSFTSSATSVLLVATATSMYGVSAGTATLSYTKSGCSATKIVTVNANPLAANTGLGTVCSGGASSLSNTTSGGTWSSSNTSIASVSPTGFVTTSATAGTALITYSISGGCYRTTNFTVNTPPAAISGSSAVCTSAPITLTDAVAGGTWISSNTARATVSSTGLVTGVSAGSAVITYRIAGCADVTKTVTISACREGNDLTQAATENGIHYSVFPNPTTGIFTISQSSAKDETAEIVINNIVGQTVYRSNVRFTGGAVQTDVTNLIAGSYLLQLKDEAGNTHVFRLIVQ
jgi:trimeric autotransporter adhesin